MEHARKMMIVPPELIQRLTASENSQPKILTQLDNEMDKILNSQLPDHDKWLQYNQVLQRFLHFAGQTRQPVSIAVENKKESLTHSDILVTLPDVYKKKAENLINTLTSSGSLNWDNNGTVTIKGVTLPSSNIIDLINDALRPRKSTSPTGWRQLAAYMKEINIPHELIGNPKRRNVTLHDKRTTTTFLTPGGHDGDGVKPEGYDGDTEDRINASSVIKQRSQATPTGRRISKRQKTLGWEPLKL